MGSGLAIPHGPTRRSRRSGALRSRSCATPSGIDWNGHQVKFVVGIAGAGNEHLPLLGKIAKVFADSAKVAELEEARTVEDVQRILGQVSNADAGA